MEPDFQFLYTTQQNALIMLGIQSPSVFVSSLVQLLRSRASKAIDSYCKRIIACQYYADEIQSGNGTVWLTTKNTPIWSIESLYLDNYAEFGDAPGAFGSNTLLTQGTNYALDWDNGPGSFSSSGLIQCIDNVWPQPIAQSFGVISAYVGPRTGNIKVSYVAGYPGTEWATSAAAVLSQNSNDVTGLSISTATPIEPGMGIIGSGVPLGTYVAEVVSSTEILMSRQATTGGTIALTFTVPAPLDVQLACELLIADIKRYGKWGQAVASGSYDGASLSFTQGLRIGLMNEEVMGALSNYVLQVVA